MGAEAVAAFVLAAPVLAWLEAREPVRVRSLSLDVARGRLLVTLEPEPGAGATRPRVLKIDPGVDAGAATELLVLAGPLLHRLGELAALKLAARSGGEH